MTRFRLSRLLGAFGGLGALFILAPTILDAVLVSPHAIFMTDVQRTEQITLVNTSDQTEEISIDLRFGFPDTDSAGNIFVRYVDAPGPEHPSAAEWVRAYPRQLRLAPGQRQVVRLLGKPPSELTDGEYWSRVVVTSRAAAAQVHNQDTLVTVGLALEIRTVISLAYRKGTVETGVALNDLEVDVEGDSLIAWVELERQGNAAYLGQQTISIRDSIGREHAEWSIPVAVYYSTRRRFAFPIDSVEPGAYSVQLDLNLDRADLPRSKLLPAAPISRSLGITIPTR